MEANARLERLADIGQFVGEGFPGGSEYEDEMVPLFDIAEQFSILPHELLDKDADLLMQYMAYAGGKAEGRRIKQRMK